VATAWSSCPSDSEGAPISLIDRPALERILQPSPIFTWGVETSTMTLTPRTPQTRQTARR
jgi:hypothetical protein